MKIVKVEWDAGKFEDYNAKSLVIGQYLPKIQNSQITHLELYGISLDIMNNAKDYQLHRYSCFTENVCSEVKQVSKQEAREALIAEIDKALDVLFDEGEMKYVDENLNLTPQEDSDDENEEY